MNLQLFNLSLPHLQSLVAGESQISDFTVTAESVPDFLVTAAVRDLENGLEPIWYSPILYVSSEDRIAVGSAAFKGSPRDGRVEVGYGIIPEYQGQGLATKGLQLVTALALAQDDVSEVYAENSVTNPASGRVLVKAGFVHIGTRESEEDGTVDCWLLGAAAVMAGV